MDIDWGPLSTVLHKLGVLIVEYNLQEGAKGEIKSLQSALQALNAIRKNLSSQRADQLDIQGNTRDWFRNLSDLSHAIDDSIDDFMICSQVNMPSELRGIKEFVNRSVHLLEYVNKTAISFLQYELKIIQRILEKLYSEPANMIQARRLRELSYDIEDRILDFMVCSQVNKLAELSGIKEFVDRSVHLLNYTNNIATKIREINSLVIGMHGPHRSYAVNLGAVDLDPPISNWDTHTKDLVGIVQTADELIKILMDAGATMQKYGKIVSIVGCEGLGKTTLYSVYDKIKPLFDCYAFVSVSQTPDLNKLFKGMLYDLGCKKIDQEIFDQGQHVNVLREFLQDKRYCIVVDDIWDISVWDMIKCALPDNDVGYIVITTTPFSHVAEVVGGAYKLKPLSLNNSQKLLYRRIFGNEKQENTDDTDKCPNQKLTEVSYRILQKHAGLPLAITSMDSLSAVGLMPVCRIFNGLCTLDFKDCDLSHGYNLNEIGKLSHLRYLGLCGTCIAQLPEEILNIQSLKFLDMTHTNISRLPTRLPRTIGKLKRLEKLTLCIDDSTMGIVEEVCHLSNLQKIQIPEVNISEGDIEEMEAALRRATEVHANRPTLRIDITNEIDSKSHVKDLHKKHEYRYKIDVAVAEPVTATVFPCLFTQYMKVPNLVGTEEAVNELMRILTEGTEMSLAHGKIVSIVGLGGLGKTTFAHAIYRKLRAQFDCWAFVSISQKPDMKKLFKCMLHQLGKKKYANTHEGILDERQLMYELNEFLEKRRYFIVIDDIRDILVWNIIKSALPTNDGGFIIVTTTCILDVAKQVGGTYIMRPLCPQNSRILLHRKTFGIEDKDEELTQISENILQKCGGIPLAIIAASGLLASKGQNKIEWYKVYNSIDSVVKNSPDVDTLQKILSLNYDDLPSHLRTCLLYLSVFPEGNDIDKDRLIRLWIAEGLIQCGKQEESPFELGESYFYELINRSMIQPVYKRWYYDMTECCQVHDMVLDLIRYLSAKEKLLYIWDHMHDTFHHSEEVQWLSLQNSMVDIATHEAAVNMQEVRSVVVFPSAVKLLPALACFKVLRVLDLQSCCLSQGCSLKYIGNLFHLRYLGLRGTGIASLSEEIGKLQFLQTLDVTGNEISSLPLSVAELKHLMCLRIDSRTRAPNGIGSFTSLEELSTLRIQDSTDIIEKLGNQTELRVLGIDCRTGWNIQRVENSLVDCLHKLQEIKTLSISMVGECNLDAWVPPRHIRRLELTGCWPSPVPALLNNTLLLVELYFLSIEVRKLRQEDLESLGRLPALSYLDIEVGNQKLGIVQKFIISARSFPCLVHCTLRGYIGPVAFQQGAMPEVSRLHLVYPVREIKEAAAAGTNGGGFDLGLGNLPRLQDVSFLLRRGGASKGEVEEAEAALRQAIESHPNHPTLEIL